MHPTLKPIVKKGLNKLLVTKIIFLVRNIEWVANLIPIRKKNMDIGPYIDFHHLHGASTKDNYHVPPMEKIIQYVLGYVMLFVLDGFSRYNQVLVSHPYQLKTTFRMQWGTYAYRKIPFGLVSASATFQRAMDVAFHGLINRVVVVYLDYVTIYWKEGNDHLLHIKHIFEHCRKYDISLNPKKSIFMITKGYIIGFVVSKDGMLLDLEQI